MMGCIEMTRIESFLPNWTGLDYAGTRFDDHYIIYTHHRDSDIADESNWRSIIKYLDEKNIIYENARFTHWAVGWIEQILVKNDNAEALKAGEYIRNKLRDYPIFNEDDYSELESEKVNELVIRIRDEITSLDDGEQLTTWGSVTRDMTDWKIADVIRDEGWVE